MHCSSDGGDIMNQVKIKVKKKNIDNVDFQYKKMDTQMDYRSCSTIQKSVYHLNKLGIQYGSNILALDFSRADLDKFKMVSKSLNHQDELLQLNTLEECLSNDNNIYKLESNLNYCFRRTDRYL